MEIVIKGEGEVVIRFVDRRGRTLMEKNFVTSGSETIQAKTDVSLFVETTSGQVPLIPVLVRQSNPKQQVTFDGEKPSSFVKKQCQDIGCTSSVAEDVEHGRARELDPNQIITPFGSPSLPHGMFNEFKEDTQKP